MKKIKRHTTGLFSLFSYPIMTTTTLLVATIIAVACGNDRKIADPNDTDHHRVTDGCDTLECGSQPGINNCTGNYREQRFTCETISEDTGNNCSTTLERKVKRFFYVGTCKNINNNCLCADKVMSEGEGLEDIAPTCVCTPCQNPPA